MLILRVLAGFLDSGAVELSVFRLWLVSLVRGGSGSFLLLRLLHVKLGLLLLREVGLLASPLIILEEHLRPIILVEEA